MKHALDESQVEEMLKNLPPGFSLRLEKRLEYAPWTDRLIRRHKLIAALSLTILSVIAFILLTPQGRAFAQTIFEFFTRTDQESFPLSDEEVDLMYAPVPTYALSLIDVTPSSPMLNYCSTPEEVGTYGCEIQRVEKQLNIDIKEFSTPPPSHTFAEIWLYPSISNTNTSNIVNISYQTSGSSLLLAQGVGDFPPASDWEKVPSSAIQQVKIGEYDGEYVNGFFGLRNGDTKLTWDATGADQRIRWREGERWFEILAFIGPGTSGYLDRQALITLASNMVYQPKNAGQTAKVDLDFIPNILMAEKICTCDIFQPGKLPNENTHLDYVRYDPQQKSITLHYGYRALRIVQTPVESALIKNLDSYKMLETVEVNGAIGQFGVSPAQKTIWESATPPVFTTNNSYNILLWEKGGTIHQIYFDQSFSGGGYLTKEQMIEIAESLR